MTQIAVATSSQLAADAAEEVASLGGNAVDCALAAALLTINTEPGVCALGGSAFITIWPAGDEPVTIDGNVAVPGAGLTREQCGHGAVSVTLAYGGGITTLVGPGSIAVPGTLAAMEHAWKRYGSVAWATIFEPTIRACRDGFPLSAACRYYLGYSGDCIFNRSDDGLAALHRADDSLLDAGETIIVPHLAGQPRRDRRRRCPNFLRGRYCESNFRPLPGRQWHADSRRSPSLPGQRTISDSHQYRRLVDREQSTTCCRWQHTGRDATSLCGSFR